MDATSAATNVVTSGATNAATIGSDERDVARHEQGKKCRNQGTKFFPVEDYVLLVVCEHFFHLFSHIFGI